MIETTTMEALPPRLESGGITVEDDAAPLARLIGRTLSRADRSAIEACSSVVTVRSHDTPQVATVRFGQGAVEVASGAASDPDVTLVVDVLDRLSPTQEPVGDPEHAAGALRALQPQLPHWRDAAASFWRATRGIAGIPDVLVVEADGPEGRERERFGEGTKSYLVAGPADLLSGLLCGADDLPTALAAGVRVQGTLAQLSVMTAASWKVRFDV